MSQAASGDTSRQFTLNPVLQTALSSFNVSLEEELARYRQAKLDSTIESPFSPRSKSQSPPESEQLPTYLQEDRLENLQTKKIFTSTTLATEVTESSPPKMTNFPESVNQVQQPENLVPLVAKETPPQDYLESSEELLNSLPEQEPLPKPTANWFSRLSTPLGAGAILILLAAAGLTFSVLIAPQNNGERLRLAEGEGDKPQPQTTEALKKPPENSTEPSANSTSPPKLDVFPNLSQGESQDLDLNTLPNLESNRRQPSESVATNTAPDANITKNTEEPETFTPNPSASSPPPPNSNLSKVLLPSVAPPPPAQPSNPSLPNRNLPSGESNSVPYAATVVPQETIITPNQSTIKIAPAPTRSDYFYVLVDYIDSNSLTQAQTAVRDAYVRNFDIGTKIQMGAFNSEADAQSLVQQLQQQGVQASIYRP